MEPEIKITAEPQNEPTLCKFIVDRPLAPGGFRFESAEEAQGSRLAEELLKIAEVAKIFIAGNTVSITRKDFGSWQETGKQVGTAIRTAIASGQDLIKKELLSDLPNLAELKSRVQRVLTEVINPAVAGHGGSIELLDVKNGDVFIKMHGGCQGCASSRATLKNGVEESIRREIPHIGAVYDTTDHAAGRNPYYTG